jgi:sugar phosphate isomerase/epimerase
MSRAIDLAGRFGIPNIVFGSPGNRRIPQGMTPDDALEQATETFHRLGDRAATAGTTIAMETNPAAYGTNFLTTLEETEAFVTQMDHAAVTLRLDLGAMHMNGAYSTVAARAKALAPLLTHVHVSEPHLAPAPDDTTDLVPILTAMRDAGYARATSIEMKRPTGGVNTLRRCIAALAGAAMAEMPT